MNKRLECYLSLLTITLFSISTINIQAAPNTDINNEKSTIESQIDENNATISDIDAEIEKLSIEIEKLDSQIVNLNIELDSNISKIKEKEKNIIDNTVALDAKKIELDAAIAKYNSRIESMYKNNISSSSAMRYISAILESNSFSDFMTKVDYYSRVKAIDEESIEVLNNTAKEYKDILNKLNDEKTGLEVLKSTQEENLETVNNAMDSQTALISELNTKKAVYISNNSDLNSKIADLDARIAAYEAEQAAKAAAEAAAAAAAQQAQNNNNNNNTNNNNNNNNNNSNPPNPVTPPSSGNVTGMDIVSYARNFLGIKYVWGGTTPNGFDCSGLTQYVYKNFGYSITRTTYTQINVGTSVSRSNLAPGDLVFFGTYADPYHVGIYVGDNMYIHAPTTGDVVKISALTRSDYLTARRIIN